MRKFSLEPRSLKSFGVVGLLEDKCKIYYDSLFSARHIGRISDLLVAKLKGTNPDDLRLRVILLHSLYETYCVQFAASGATGSDALNDPLTVECGVDTKKLALGVSFRVNPEQALNLDEITDHIQSRQPTNPLEKLLSKLVDDADHLLLKVHSQQRRVEIVTFLSLTESTSNDGSVSFQAVPMDTQEESPSFSGEYIELGDLDYNQLLKDDAQKVELGTPATGEILAKKTSELADAIRLRAEQTQQNDVVRISGTTETIDGSAQTVSSGASGNHSEPESKQVLLYRQRIEELQNRIAQLESQAQYGASKPSSSEAKNAASVSAPPIATPDEAEDKRLSIKEIIEKVWPFKKQQEASAAATTQAAQSAAALVAAQNITPPEPKSATPTEEREAPKEADEISIDSVEEARKLVTEEVGILETKIVKAQQESQTLKTEMNNPKAQKWVDGMVGEMLTEKARLNELGKKIGVSLRQKELEFKSKEMHLQEEIRKRDETIRQRLHAFNRLKEQLTQVTVQLEKAKTNMPNPAEEIQMRQKLTMTQKILNASKDENLGLMKKIEDLRDQLAASNNASKEKKSTGDFNALKLKHERVLKQVEEFKRVNQQLLEKLNEATRPKPAALNPDDLKRRLDVSMKLAASYQKDAEKLKLKLEEASREELRLKGELNRVLLVMKNSQKNAKPTPGESDDGSGNQAA